MSATQPREFDFKVSPEEIEAVYAPYVHRRLDPGDPEIEAILKRSRREWRVKRVRRALERVWRPWRRTPEEVKENYNGIWGRFDFTNLRPDKPRKLYAMAWDGAYQLVNAWGVPRVHLYLLMKLIETIQPRSVLEVGYGPGLNLIALAARFPDVQFAGIELSDSGPREARALADREALPEELREFIPFELRDLSAVKRIDFQQGSAAELPFEDDGFDLVYTRQALEQMEPIRDAVFGEIARVAGQRVVMFEAFRDWNDRGIYRDRVVVTNYFAATLADLEQYGLRAMFATPDLPHKIYMRVGLAVAEVLGAHPTDRE